MGFNNPAFVDDDNKSSNKGSAIRLNDKHVTSTTSPSTNDVIHETTVILNSVEKYIFSVIIHNGMTTNVIKLFVRCSFFSFLQIITLIIIIQVQIILNICFVCTIEDQCNRCESNINYSNIKTSSRTWQMGK